MMHGGLKGAQDELTCFESALAALQRSSKVFDKLKEQQAPGSKHPTA